MSTKIFLLKNGIEEEDIPKNIVHLIVAHDYNKILYNLPETIFELTIMTNNKVFYNNIPTQIKIINISLSNLCDGNIILENLPFFLEKIRITDYSKYTEFEFLEKNVEIYIIEVKRRQNMLKIIKKHIIKIPFGCIITNKYNEELVDLLNVY